ncbi:hypothetical protein CYMTET_51217 [Cymbomonas tetramitiformis]|uniref:Uncharacterized protein n=1 Tax=Cymbomonas tetramitiformis TaxID=36881 RepID=A0AAE0BN94_9CHLO|nr:hypothetical protein CYMTET_51217 [Cymbomonas tetramitiformis]
MCWRLMRREACIVVVICLLNSAARLSSHPLPPDQPAEYAYNYRYTYRATLNSSGTIFSHTSMHADVSWSLKHQSMRAFVSGINEGKIVSLILAKNYEEPSNSEASLTIDYDARKCISSPMPAGTVYPGPDHYKVLLQNVGASHEVSYTQSGCMVSDKCEIFTVRTPDSGSAQAHVHTEWYEFNNATGHLVASGSDGTKWCCMASRQCREQGGTSMACPTQAAQQVTYTSSTIYDQPFQIFRPEDWPKGHFSTDCPIRSSLPPAPDSSPVTLTPTLQPTSVPSPLATTNAGIARVLNRIYIVLLILAIACCVGLLFHIAVAIRERCSTRGLSAAERPFLAGQELY